MKKADHLYLLYAVSDSVELTPMVFHDREKRTEWVKYLKAKDSKVKLITQDLNITAKKLEKPVKVRSSKK